MPELRLAETLSLPLPESAIYAYAILGVRGGGKTWTATLAAEQYMEAGIPITAVDPIGRWWGLKVARAAGEQGYPVVVVGGRHADIELDPDHDLDDVERLVIAAVQHRISLVVDLYGRQYTKSFRRQLVKTVADVHLDYNEEHGRRHVFLEEAAEYAPQRVQGELAQCFEAVETLVRMGRNINCGVTMVNQRAADLNKSILEQCEIVVAHQQTGRNSLKALREWMDLAGAGEKEDLVAELPSLQKGTAWFWAPRLKMLQKCTVLAKRTIHPDPESGHWDPTVAGGAMKRDVSSSIELLIKAMSPPPAPKPEATPPPQPELTTDEKDKALAELDEENEQLATQLAQALSKVATLETQLKNLKPMTTAKVDPPPVAPTPTIPDDVVRLARVFAKLPKLEVTGGYRDLMLHRAAELAVQRVGAWILSQPMVTKRALQWVLAAATPPLPAQVRDALVAEDARLTADQIDQAFGWLQSTGLVTARDGHFCPSVVEKLAPYLNGHPGVETRLIHERTIKMLELMVVL